MGPYLAKPETSIQSHDDEDDRFFFSTSEMQGWRKTQEDAHSAILNYLENGSNDSAFFAVYDGHGGDEVSKYCALHFPPFLKKRLAFADGNYTDVIRQAFLEFDRTLKEPHVISELKKLASMDDEEMEDIGEDESSILRKEAQIPLEELIKDADGNEILKEDKNGESSKDEPATSSSSSSAVDDKGDKVEVDSVEKKDYEKTPKNGEATEATEAPAEASGSAEASSNGKGSSKSDAAPAVEASDLENKPSSSGTSKKSLGNGAKSELMRALNQQIYDAFFKNCPSDDDDDEEDDEEEDDEEDDEEGDESEDGTEDDEEEEGDEEDDEEDSDDDFQVMGSSDSPFGTVYNTPGSGSGCTAIAAVIFGNTLYVANVGDSRCVLSRDGTAVEMSEDHKPEDEEEKRRIVKAGGEVTADGRVNGGLNLSRAIGDHLYKKNEALSDIEQMVTALPDIRTHEIDMSKDQFMFLACDGIWNSMSNQEVVDFIGQRLEKDVPCKTICEELFKHCLAPNTDGDGSGCDNMTCILVKFKKNGAVSSKRALEEENGNGQPNDHSEAKKVKTDEDSAPAASSSSSAPVEAESCVPGPSASASS